MLAFVKIALATWALAWVLSFWHKTDRLRERLGVYFVVHPETGDLEDRVDGGGLGAWLNCPMCAAVLASPVAVLLWWLWPDGLEVLAGVGLALLLVRWYESLRVKREWWL